MGILKQSCLTGLKTLPAAAQLRPFAIAVIFSLCALFADARITGSAAYEHSDPQTLVVGATVSLEDEDEAYMAKRLQAGLAPHGISSVKFEIADTNGELQKLIDERRVDMVVSHGLAIVKVLSINSTAAVFQSAGPDFTSSDIILVVRKDSPIHSLEDLRGRHIAFENVRQRKRFFSPAWLLLSRGLDLSYAESIRATPKADRVNVSFSGHRENMTAWLYHGLVDAIAFGREDWEDDDVAPPEARENFRIIFDERQPHYGYLTMTSRKAAALEAAILDSLNRSGGEPNRSVGAFSPLSQTHDQRLRTLAEMVKRSRTHLLANE